MVNFKPIFTFLTISFVFFQSCDNKTVKNTQTKADTSSVVLYVLGNVQDAGSPHIACKKDCCKDLFLNPDPERKVVSLGLADLNKKQNWLFEASPDIASQLKYLQQKTGSDKELPEGIFLTHAHIGHYSGLMYLGKEACSASDISVYAMPKMCNFLQNNGPWSQLLTEKNIRLNQLFNDSNLQLNERIKVRPIRVPHRDEFSETVAYLIQGPRKKMLFIPDIDKWQKWDRSILSMADSADYLLIDATFFSGDEIKQRDISEIPHPFVIESMELFRNSSLAIKNKIWFIHLNHSNPLLDIDSKASAEVESKGFHIARFGANFIL